MKKRELYKISLSVMKLFGVVFVLLFSNSRFCYGIEKPLYVKFVSCDTVTINGKIMFPLVKQNDIVVINVQPSVVTRFLEIHKEMKTERKFISMKVRDKLLENGCTYFEFLGRKDSIWIYNRLYPVSTMYTKAQDLKAAINYVRSRADLKNKKIILYGHSEGGDVSAIVASKNPNVHAIVLMSTGATNGIDVVNYQSKCRDSLFMGTFGTHPEVLTSFYDQSSVKEKNYELNFNGYNRYKKEMFGPLADIVYRYENYDTIASHVIRFLEQ